MNTFDIRKPLSGQKKLYICGHRGDRTGADENTMAAFRRAVKAGADLLETDVHMTKDGEIVLCHNGDIPGTGEIKDCTCEELINAKPDLPKLSDHVGEDLIVTDVTTLLGADCKAGVAEIVTAAESMLCDPYLPHPEVRIVFTPDEEIGRGPDRIDMEKVNCDFGYTMDGCLVGELEYENFNAWRADIVISGVAVHPGSSFGIMKNASLIAAEFISMLPEKETPYYTKEREGFYHLTNMEGGVESARLKYILRDHDMKKEQERIRVIEETAAKLNEKYGEGTVTAVISEQYRNMKEKLIPGHEDILEAARAGIAAIGETLSEPAVRGGTDGARFSFMGLPCPNLGMGAFYCHGPHEFTTVQQMEKGVKLILNILERIR